MAWFRLTVGSQKAVVHSGVRTRASRAHEPNRIYAETCALRLPTSICDEKLVYRVFLRQYVQIAKIYLHLAKFYLV